MAGFGQSQEWDKALSEKIYCMEMNDTRYFLTEQQLVQELPNVNSIEDVQFKYDATKGYASYEGAYEYSYHHNNATAQEFSVIAVEDKEQLKSLMTWENHNSEFNCKHAMPMMNAYPDFVPKELRSANVLCGSVEPCLTVSMLPDSMKFNETVVKYVQEFGLTSKDLSPKTDELTLARREIAQRNYVSPVTKEEVIEICSLHGIDFEKEFSKDGAKIEKETGEEIKPNDFDKDVDEHGEH